MTERGKKDKGERKRQENEKRGTGERTQNEY